MLVDRKKMQIARDRRAAYKQAQKEENCPNHEFLLCSKPNMVSCRVSYNLFEMIQQGTLTYHKCWKCNKEVI